MSAFECKRCGKCCKEFRHQIRFTEKELSESKLKELKDARVTLFLTLQKFQRTEIKSERCVLVPIYADLITFLEKIDGENIDRQFDLNEETILIMRNLLKNVPNNDLNSCLFLECENGQYGCCIHNHAPEMCKIYPSNHGFACLGQRERYETKEFYEFQKKRVKSAIAVLKMIFESKIKNPISFEILTLLMDYGAIPRALIHEFFEKEMNASKEAIESAVKELVEQSLLFLFMDKKTHQELMKSVTYEDVNRIVDKIMEEKGWTVS